jgi:hypothetical protein
MVPGSSEPSALMLIDPSLCEQGLLIHPDHSFKFFVEDGPRKVWELRNFAVRCLAEGQQFWLIESKAGKNQDGVSLYKIVALVKFLGNIVLATHEDVCNNFDKTLVTKEEYDQLRNSWKSRAKGVACTAWHIDVVCKLKEPVYGPWNHQASL